jgi:hypothetical protein
LQLASDVGLILLAFARNWNNSIGGLLLGLLAGSILLYKKPPGGNPAAPKMRRAPTGGNARWDYTGSTRASRAMGKSGGASNDTHHADLADANRRAALAQREAALWHATAEVLRLDRDIRREQAHRGRLIDD